jgi:hypothetical protein
VVGGGGPRRGAHEEAAAQWTAISGPLVAAPAARGEAPLGGDLVRTMAAAPTARVAAAAASMLRCAVAHRGKGDGNGAERWRNQFLLQLVGRRWIRAWWRCTLAAGDQSKRQRVSRSGGNDGDERPARARCSAEVICRVGLRPV